MIILLKIGFVLILAGCLKAHLTGMNFSHYFKKAETSDLLFDGGLLALLIFFTYYILSL
jgi:hypothetical protein